MKPHLERIVLTGFMGAGKTTVGRLLAARLRWEFADLDTVVEERTGRSVPELFANEGEAAFRQAETEALATLLARSHTVIALGGGALGTPALQNLLTFADSLAVVHLQAPFSLLYDRCQAQAREPAATERPLLRERDAAEQRYLRRQPVYAATAHLEIDVSTATPEGVVERICTHLAKETPPKP